AARVSADAQRRVAHAERHEPPGDSERADADADPYRCRRPGSGTTPASRATVGRSRERSARHGGVVIRNRANEPRWHAISTVLVQAARAGASGTQNIRAPTKTGSSRHQALEADNP